MRASRSWPRSSVPSGCCQDGPFSFAVKSISLIGTVHTNGPISTASVMRTSSAMPTTASLCRRKRRQASAQGEWLTRFAAGALAIGDTGIEQAIEDVGEQVAED